MIRLLLVGLLSAVSWLGIETAIVSSQESDPDDNVVCPTDLETLTALLLEDIPGYANRVIQRADLLSDEKQIDTYVIIAGQPEFAPLSLAPGWYDDPATNPEPPQQVFFTTLERQYLDNKVFTVENYYWLFLAQTSDGWRMNLLYTRLGSPLAAVPPRPPLEVSEGIVGQAVHLWLRDCRAGAIRR